MPVEIGSAEDMLRLYNQGKPAAGITITIEQWLKWTDLGILHKRSDQMRAIDDALRAFHLAQGNAVDGAFLRLKSAFDSWIAFQQRQGKNWKQSDRNKNGAVVDLFNEITLYNANRKTGGRSEEEMTAIRTIISAEQRAMERLFVDRTMVFKDAVKSKKTAAEVARTEKVKAAVMPAYKAGRAVYKAATTSMDMVTPDGVGEACTKILGTTPPDQLFMMLGHGTFTQFCSASSTIIGAAVSPGKLLVDIVKIGMAASTRYSVSGARYVFRAGAPDAAINAVLQMIDDELKMLALDAAKQTGSIVASAFGAGPIAAAASAVVDLMVNIKAYRDMMREIEAANRMLGQWNYNIELFNISPVLGCYFLLMADTSVWINFPMQDIGYPGWMDQVEAMRKRAEPVREKCRELIRKSKIAMSGTEFFNGIEWEPSWRNNKMEYLAAGQGVINATRKLKAEVGLGPAVGPQHKKPPPGSIYGQGPSGRGP